ncbi:MAG: hypothetical protein EOP53_16740, partial [Sphingobacteriales bacterium]
VFPAMDFERVYGSDMKKMIKWLDILTKAGVEIKLSEAGEEGEETEAPVVAEKKTKAAAPKNTAAPKTNSPAKKINTPRKMA